MDNNHNSMASESCRLGAIKKLRGALTIVPAYSAVLFNVVAMAEAGQPRQALAALYRVSRDVYGDAVLSAGQATFRRDGKAVGDAASLLADLASAAKAFAQCVCHGGDPMVGEAPFDAVETVANEAAEISRLSVQIAAVARPMIRRFGDLS